jgi:DNA-binding NtrC family response regulator
MNQDPAPATSGSSRAPGAFLARIAQVAASGATVLIRGESGSGKNRAAEQIHAASPRASGPLVAVSLAALSPTLIEAELFGHEAGAFTGAVRARRGRFRQADGGTLVLDDVDSLPLDAQVKLLRVLQERVVEPLGAEGPVPVDVRVLCTSTRDLRELVARGTFRPDLYYRLAVVELEVPPLRARPDEVAPLARSLVEQIAVQRKLPRRELSPAAIERLRSHPWPGNVRELENALERVLTCPPNGASAPVAAEEFAFLAEELAGAPAEIAERALALGLTLEQLEQAVIQAAWRAHRGNLAAAARQVGLSRRAFEYRCERMRPDEREGHGA